MLTSDIEAVGAREVVIPVGFRNRFGHPKADVVERYEATGVGVWRTDRDGAVTIHLARAGVDIEAWRQVRQRYWQ